jgi:hypothetical protein
MSISILEFRPRFAQPRPLLAKTQSRAADTAASGFQHIFVIAGPSGSGKSTFMREFVEDRLPSNVSRALPAEAKIWSRTSGNELSRKGLAHVVHKTGGGPGLVVHYDIMRAHTRGYQDFANDPAMQAMTAANARLTVLTILPRREVLFEQFLSRARSGEYEEWWDRRETLRRVKRKLRATLLRLFRRQAKFLKEGHLALLSVYASDARFDHWTSRWKSFLEGVRHGRNDVRLVYIAPDDPDGDYPRFRLLRSF